MAPGRFTATTVWGVTADDPTPERVATNRRNRRDSRWRGNEYHRSKWPSGEGNCRRKFVKCLSPLATIIRLKIPAEWWVRGSCRAGDPNHVSHTYSDLTVRRLGRDKKVLEFYEHPGLDGESV
jgi:hypothetical protein